MIACALGVSYAIVGMGAFAVCQSGLRGSGLRGTFVSAVVGAIWPLPAAAVVYALGLSAWQQRESAS
jgi:hypothetical protein